MTPREGKDSDSSDSRKKHLLFLCFHLFCRFFWIFFSPAFPSVVVVDFIGTMKSNLAFELFFFFVSVTFFTIVKNLCLYIGLLQFYGVFLFSFSVFLIFNFLNLLFFLHLFFCLLFLLFFSPCSYSLLYINLL